jgi:cytochrome c oxidase cbb3-type subunit III
MYILKTLMLFKYLMKFLAVWIFLVPLFFSGCSSEPATQHAEQLEKSPSSFKPPTRAIGISLVTEETREVYQRYCAQCHGEEGHGDGVNAMYLVVPPRDHTKADYIETRSDQQLFDAIKFGGLAVGRAPCMPSWGHTFEDEMVHSLVSFIRELCDCKAF